MKTAISVPDRLFEAAERLARRLGVSRSQLYATAMAEFVEQHGHDRVRERLDEVYSTEESVPDSALSAMQRASIQADEW